MFSNKLINRFLLSVLCSTSLASYVFAETNDEFMSKEDAYLLKKITNMPTNPDNMPSLTKGFSADYLPNNITLGRSDDDTDEKILEVAKKYKPENYNDYAKILCPRIISETKKEKNITLPNIKDSSNLPEMPKFTNIRLTARLWIDYISLLMEYDGNDNAAIVLPYGSYYIARDIQESYAGGFLMGNKSIATALCNMASDRIIKIISKPKKKSYRINKYLAKDLISLVNKDYLFSECIKAERGLLYYVFYEQQDSKDPNKKAFAEKVLNSEYFKKMDNLFFIELKSFIDKPYYLCKNELDSYNKKINNKQDEMAKDLEEFQKYVEEVQRKNIPESEINIDPSKVIAITINQLIQLAAPSYCHYKTLIEKKLAKMEIVAIALAYNAFYCENNKEPANIEELEKWFGEKLPVNRFDGKPYEFYKEKGYVIYNYGINQKKDNEKYDNDDIYFSFSK